MATAAMQDREYEKEEALRSLATNHQRIRPPGPRRVTSSQVSHTRIYRRVRPTVHGEQPNDTRLLQSSGPATMMDSRIGVDSDAVSMTPIQQLWQSLLIYDN
jgi:hypothetical protein